MKRIWFGISIIIVTTMMIAPTTLAWEWVPDPDVNPPIFIENYDIVLWGVLKFQDDYEYFHNTQFVFTGGPSDNPEGICLDYNSSGSLVFNVRFHPLIGLDTNCENPNRMNTKGARIQTILTLSYKPVDGFFSAVDTETITVTSMLGQSNQYLEEFHYMWDPTKYWDGWTQENFDYGDQYKLEVTTYLQRTDNGIEWISAGSSVDVVSCETYYELFEAQ